MRSRLLLLVLSALGAVSGQNIVVVSQVLSLEETHTLLVDPTLEYIIKFVPSAEQRTVPMRVWLRTTASDVTRPLLLTARQRTGAVSWQLPHVESHVLMNEIERTLCPDDAVDDAPSDCVGSEQTPRGEFTLHVSSACATRVTLQLRVTPARDWLLHDSLNISAALAAPHVSYYRWREGEERVRLVISSGDNVCATIAVQAYACPILQTTMDIGQADTRMTVLRSGGSYISRSRYPRGFYVVTLVPEMDIECRPAEVDTPDWLFESVWGGAAPAAPPPGEELVRVKHLTLEIKVLFYVVTLVPEMDIECRPAEVDTPDWLFESVWGGAAPAAPPPGEELVRVKHLTLEIKVLFYVVTLVPEMNIECRPAEVDTPDWLFESVWGGAAPAAPPPGEELVRVKHLTLEIKVLFYVVTLVPEMNIECRPAEVDTPDWLFESVWGGAAPAAPPPGEELVRVKHLTLEIKAGLTRGEYWIGATVTLASFLMFYVLFGVLVLAERWPRWYRLVAPRAVLADHNRTETGETEIESTADAAEPVHRRRRGSTATFDSSDASDTDSAEEESPGAGGTAGVEGAARGAVRDTAAARGAVAVGEGEVAPATNGIDMDRVQVNGTAGPDAVTIDGERPFGLPARLHVAALARRRGRVLKARSQRYLHTLYTVAVFYALPGLQFVFAFQVIMNIGGSLDLCYYNWLCAHPWGIFSDFNHVLSNLGYLLLGALYMLQLRRRRMRRARHPRNEEEYGIPSHYGLSASLGASLMVVGLLSASYHICPNRLNFQFDTAFMYVLTVLVMVKIYQSRHPDINARAHSTFAVLALIIALVVWGVLGGGPLFWSVFTVLHVFTFLLLSLRIYYVGQFRLEKASLAVAAASLRGSRPLYTARLVALLVANAVNWAFAIYGLITQPANIASHLLFVLLCNALLHMVFYLCMKLLHGERPRWYAWLYLGGAAAAWMPALYFFVSASSDWSASPAESRLLNHECRVLRFYDSHDLWHALSAVALYLTLNALLTWDDGLAAVKRTDIAVF